MPRKMPEPAMDVADDVVSTDTSEQDNGVRQPPYQTQWITIKDAAAFAGVTGQSVRNAYENHAAFNPENDPSAWFRTKMVDQFGNTTEYDVVYVDKAAVQRWIEARADKPTYHRSPDAAKRYIIRLTDDQVTMLQTFLADQVGFQDVKIEKPPQAARKPKADQPAPEASNGHASVEGSEATSDTLFNVDLIEA